MFQFSLFSSFIPYLTIAVMYVLYLGLYTYNKLHAEKEPVTAEETTENIVSWQPAASENTMQLAPGQFLTDDFTAGPVAEQEPVTPLVTFRKIPVPSIEIPATGCLCFELFSRPPPAIA